MLRKYTDEDREFRAKVIKRDKGKCRMPGCNKRFKHVHHIFPYSKYPSLRFDSSNGVCLCFEHHKVVTRKESYYIDMFLKIINENSS